MIAVLTIAALVQFAEWEEWITLLFGVWVIIAPWVLGFSAVTAATAAFVVLGIIIAVASCSELWMVHHPTAAAG